VVILSSGQVVATGPVKQVIGQTQRNVLRVQVATAKAEEAQKVLATLPKVVQVAPATDQSGWLRIELVGPADGVSPEDVQINNILLEALIRADIPILSFQAEGGRLQDVFLYLTEEAIR